MNISKTELIWTKNPISIWNIMSFYFARLEVNNVRDNYRPLGRLHSNKSSGQAEEGWKILNDWQVHCRPVPIWEGATMSTVRTFARLELKYSHRLFSALKCKIVSLFVYWTRRPIYLLSVFLETAGVRSEESPLFLLGQAGKGREAVRDKLRIVDSGGSKRASFSINNKLQNLNDFFSINGNYFVCSFFFNAPFYGNVSYLASNRNKTLLYPIQDWVVTCSSELVR